jgi:hypothetical protein
MVNLRCGRLRVGSILRRAWCRHRRIRRRKLRFKLADVGGHVSSRLVRARVTSRRGTRRMGRVPPCVAGHMSSAQPGVRIHDVLKRISSRRQGVWTVLHSRRIAPAAGPRVKIARALTMALGMLRGRVCTGFMRTVLHMTSLLKLLSVLRRRVVPGTIRLGTRSCAGGDVGVRRAAVGDSAADVSVPGAERQSVRRKLLLLRVGLDARRCSSSGVREGARVLTWVTHRASRPWVRRAGRPRRRRRKMVLPLSVRWTPPHKSGPGESQNLAPAVRQTEHGRVPHARVAARLRRACGLGAALRSAKRCFVTRRRPRRLWRAALDGTSWGYVSTDARGIAWSMRHSKPRCIGSVRGSSGSKSVKTS